MKRALHQLLDEARRRGWQVDMTRNSHWRLRGPNQAMLFTGSTPSDHRGVRNLRSDIRRAERTDWRRRPPE
jgi:hypothetical protein